MIRLLLIVPILLPCLFSGPVMAQYFTNVPVVLRNEQTAHAGEVNTNFQHIVDNGNDVFNDFEAQITALGSQVIPSGIVLFFNLSSCPPGWKLSDGTSGTVDLRGRFVHAVTAAAEVGTVETSKVAPHNFNVTASPQVIRSMNFVTVQSGAGFAVITGATTGVLNIGLPTTGRHGSETRPKNVALRPCQKS